MPPGDFEADWVDDVVRGGRAGPHEGRGSGHGGRSQSKIEFRETLEVAFDRMHSGVVEREAGDERRDGG